MSNRHEPPKTTKKSSKATVQEEKNTSTIANDWRDRAHQAGEEVRKYVTSAVGDMDHFKGDVEKTVRKEPLKAVLVALGAGFLVGLLTRR